MGRGWIQTILQCHPLHQRRRQNLRRSQQQLDSTKIKFRTKIRRSLGPLCGAHSVPPESLAVNRDQKRIKQWRHWRGRGRDRDKKLQSTVINSGLSAVVFFSIPNPEISGLKNCLFHNIVYGQKMQIIFNGRCATAAVINLDPRPAQLPAFLTAFTLFSYCVLSKYDQLSLVT